MPLSPKSPRAPSRLPRKPSTPIHTRAPKRLPATPHPQQKAKRIPTTPPPTPQSAVVPVRPDKHSEQMGVARTPKRTPKRIPNPAARTEQTDVTRTPKRTPKRIPNPDAGSDIVKKRRVEELATKRVLPTGTMVPSNSRSKSDTGKNTKDKHNTLPTTKPGRTPTHVNNQKSLQKRLDPDKKPTTDSSRPGSDGHRITKTHKKRQPKVKIVKSEGHNSSAERKEKDDNMTATDLLPKQKGNRIKRDSGSTPAKSTERDHSEQQREGKVSKPKTKKKQPTPGRFDLRFPDVDDEEKSSAPSLKKSPETGLEQAALSPQIMINETMSESKLQLLESSPLNRLIPEKDRKAAAAEVAAQKITSARKGKKRSSGLSSTDPFVPLDKSENDTARECSIENAQLEAARKKEARKMKRKVRQMQKRGELPDNDGEENSNRAGVVYLGHIPHGFYEKEMRSYFSQFGEVTRLRLSRSKKTGRSRGFAFLEFSDADVASIAAEAMDGYLMHGQALVAKVVPEEKVHPDTFKGADRAFRKVPWSSIERRKMIERAKDPLKLATRSRRVQKTSKAKLHLLSKKGIKYDFPELSS